MKVFRSSHLRNKAKKPDIIAFSLLILRQIITRIAYCKVSEIKKQNKYLSISRNKIAKTKHM